MTVTLDNRTAIALHPLDLTTPNSESSCLGLVQSFPVGSQVGSIADIILGVPFMRSTYTVLAYEPPNSDGSFSAPSGANINPRLGLLGLTNATQALDEFHTVRVLNQPLPQSGAGQSTGAGNAAAASTSTKKLSVGIEVLIGLVGFFALCIALFCARWFIQRRRMQRERAMGRTVGMDLGGNTDGAGGGGDAKDEFMMQDVAYRLARRSSYGSRYGPSEETIRAKKYAEYLKQGEARGGYTDDTARTRVAEVDEEKFADDAGGADAEMGYQVVKGHSDSDSETDSPRVKSAFLDPRATLVGSPPTEPKEFELARALTEYPASPTTASHQRVSSTDTSVAMPLLAHTRSDSHFSLGENGYAGVGAGTGRVPLGLGRPASRARVGSIGSANAIDEERRLSFSSVHSRSSTTAGTLPRLARSPSGPRQASSPGGASPSHPLSPPPLLNLGLGSNDASQLSVSSEATNGHIS